MSALPRGGTTKSMAAIRRLVASDVAALLAITARSPEAAQWWSGGYQRIGSQEFDGWVAELPVAGNARQEKQIAGFLVARVMADEMEILNLAVEPGWRRLGVAGKLLETALAQGRASGARRVFLEVRESNVAAIAFYQAHGFAPAGRRPRYYSDPPEDALVLSLQLARDSV